jgi:hypothetical protein
MEKRKRKSSVAALQKQMRRKWSLFPFFLLRQHYDFAVQQRARVN